MATDIVFKRQQFQPSTLRQPSVAKELMRDPVYGQLFNDPRLTLARLTPGFTYGEAVEITRRVLGDDYTRFFLKEGGRVIFQMAAYVLQDELLAKGNQQKDLQLNLFCNMIKKMVQMQSIHPAQYFEAAEKIMVKLGLSVALRKEIEAVLLNNGNVKNPHVIILSAA